MSQRVLELPDKCFGAIATTHTWKRALVHTTPLCARARGRALVKPSVAPTICTELPVSLSSPPITRSQHAQAHHPSMSARSWKGSGSALHGPNDPCGSDHRGFCDEGSHMDKLQGIHGGFCDKGSPMDKLQGIQ